MNGMSDEDRHDESVTVSCETASEDLKHGGIGGGGEDIDTQEFLTATCVYAYGTSCYLNLLPAGRDRVWDTGLRSRPRS